MWESNSKSTIVKNVLLVILILALVGGLLYAMIRVREMNALQDEKLSEIHVQQQQQQAAARTESLASVQNEYDKDMQRQLRISQLSLCAADLHQHLSLRYLRLCQHH